MVVLLLKSSPSTFHALRTVTWALRLFCPSVITLWSLFSALDERGASILRCWLRSWLLAPRETELSYAEDSCWSQLCSCQFALEAWQQSSVGDELQVVSVLHSSDADLTERWIGCAVHVCSYVSRYVHSWMLKTRLEQMFYCRWVLLFLTDKTGQIVKDMLYSPTDLFHLWDCLFARERVVV